VELHRYFPYMPCLDKDNVTLRARTHTHTHRIYKIVLLNYIISLFVYMMIQLGVGVMLQIM